MRTTDPFQRKSDITFSSQPLRELKHRKHYDLSLGGGACGIHCSITCDCAISPLGSGIT